MFGIGAPEMIVMLLFMLGGLAVGLFGLYWLIRLAVRHGSQDASSHSARGVIDVPRQR